MMEPAHHRLPDRVRAHGLICLIALILQNLTRTRLREKPVQNVFSPEHALAILRRIQTHRMLVPNNRTVTGISTVHLEQSAIFESIGVEKPTATDSYTSL
jgi:hypothetical protein